MRLAWVAVGAVALFAASLSVVATRHGPQVTDDSANYLAGARTVAAGDGYLSYSGEEQTLFPPGYSLSLAALDQVGLAPVDGARWLDAVAFAALVVLTFLLARRHVHREWLAVASAAAVGGSAAMLNVYSSIWSEPVFGVVTVALLLVLERLASRRGRGAGWAIAAAALASVGFGYRYAGVVLLLLPLVTIAVAAWRDGVVAVLRRLAPYVLACLVLPAIVVGRNLAEGSTWLGRRRGEGESLRRVVDDSVHTLRAWATGAVSVPGALASVVLAALLVLTVVGLVAAFRRARREAGRDGALSLLPLVTFCVAYVVYLWASELSTPINSITTRLLAPAFAPLTVLVFCAVDALLDVDAVRRVRWVAPAAGIAIAIVLVVFAARAVRDARFIDRTGREGTAARARDVPALVAALDRFPPGTPLYSNDPVGLYLATGHEPSAFPFAGFPGSGSGSRAGGDETVLVWREPNPKPAIRDPEQLRAAGVELEAVASTDGWAVYRVVR